MNSFDNKVYDYIKNNETGGESGEVGTIIRKSTRTPPLTGTWKLRGVYGNKIITSERLEHNFQFLGDYIIDAIRITEDVPDMNNMIYLDNILGSYTVITPIGATTLEKKGFTEKGDILYCYYPVANTDGTWSLAIYPDNSISFTITTGTTDYNYTATLMLKLLDVNNIPESTTQGLIFEYERTA